jgi:hypothetical protein
MRREQMTLARVVTFEGVTNERIDEMRRQMSESAPPEGLRPTEVLVLHDPEAEKATAIVFFDTEDDYADGDAVLNAMDRGETPGGRVDVSKYNVAIRLTPSSV